MGQGQRTMKGQRPASFLPAARVPWWIVLAVAGLASPLAGCGSITQDRCDSICKCESCGDRERQECEDKADANVDVADAYECYELLEPYYNCQIEKHECKDHRYEDDNAECGHELEQYKKCIDARSSLDNGGYTPGF